jgi:hypothetical protein
MAPPHKNVHKKREKKKARRGATNYPNQPRGPGQNEGPGEAPPPPGPGGGGGSGGGGGGAEPPPDDLGIPGLPASEAATIHQFFVDDPEHGAVRALAWLRTKSAWYKQEYKGIQEGFAKGIVGNEAEYKAYENQIQVSYRGYYGRAATRDEIAAFLTAGYNARQVAQIGAGHAYAEAYRGDIQQSTGAFGGGQLTDQELQAYGQEQSGFDTALGQKIMARVQKSLTTAQRVFQGTLGSSALGDQALSETLQNRKKADISA